MDYDLPDLTAVCLLCLAEGLHFRVWWDSDGVQQLQDHLKRAHHVATAVQATVPVMGSHE